MTKGPRSKKIAFSLCLCSLWFNSAVFLDQFLESGFPSADLHRARPRLSRIGMCGVEAMPLVNRGKQSPTRDGIVLPTESPIGVGRAVAMPPLMPPPPTTRTIIPPARPVSATPSFALCGRFAPNSPSHKTTVSSIESATTSLYERVPMACRAWAGPDS